MVRVVVELGEKSEYFGWKVGDRVSGIANVGCGYCKNCMEGRFTICMNYGNQQVHSMYGHISPGAYAQYMKASIKSIAKIPDDMDHNVASMMDTLSIGLHVVEHSGLKAGETVFVNGDGAQGWMAIICAKAMGAGRILCSGCGNRLEKAVELGAVPIDFTKVDVVETVKRMTGGVGAQRVMECTGVPQGVRNACFACAPGGVVSVIGLPKDDILIPVRHLVMNEIEFVGNRANPNTLEQAIVIADRYKEDLAGLISHVFPMTEFGKALDTFVRHADNSLKVVVKPQL
jgi:threonine dehydrogenase-like Zn-dependent dehydrogenase